MTSDRITSEALSLPAADRLEVIEQLWESLAADPTALELTPLQREELDRRIAEMESNPAAAIPWQDVKAESRKQR